MSAENRKPIPIFEAKNFCFYGDMPAHIEKVPHIENFVGAYGVFEALPSSQMTRFLASDISSEVTAVQLAYARVNYLQKLRQSAVAIGSVIILNPDMSETRVSEEQIVGE